MNENRDQSDLQPITPETAERIRQRLIGMSPGATGGECPSRSTIDSTPKPAVTTSCRECRGTGYVRVVDVGGNLGVIRCQCQRDRIVAANAAKIPERFRKCSFGNYVPCDGVQQRALDQVASEFTGSFFLAGDYGRGKTHLATAQYMELVKIERPCLFFSMAELLNELRKAEMDREYYCEVQHRTRYADRFHLFIDDIDKFKVTDFKFEVLFDLLNTVYARNLGLTVTSNFSVRELKRTQRLDGSITRRIEDICRKELQV